MESNPFCFYTDTLFSLGTAPWSTQYRCLAILPKGATERASVDGSPLILPLMRGDSRCKTEDSVPNSRGSFCLGEMLDRSGAAQVSPDSKR